MSFPGVFVPHVPVITNQDSAPEAKRRSAFGAARKPFYYLNPAATAQLKVPMRAVMGWPPDVCHGCPYHRIKTQDCTGGQTGHGRWRANSRTPPRRPPLRGPQRSAFVAVAFLAG